MAHGIVRKEAYSACGEWWQPGKVSRLVLTQEAVQNFERIALELLALVAFFQSDLVAASAQHHIRTYAEKGVSANFFAALHGFEQKGIGSVLFIGGDAQKSGDRSAQVSGNGFCYWDQSCVFGQRGKLLVIRPEHGNPS